jgi:cytochrome P450
MTTTTTTMMPTGYRTVPGPKPMNNILSVLGFAMQAQRNLLELMDGQFKRYGDTFMFEAMKRRQYMFSHPDHIQEIVLTQASKFHKESDYKNEKHGLARFMGNGLVVSDGEFWKRQRKLSAPALHARRIQNYAGTMVEYTAQMLDQWQDGARLDIADEMMRLTLNIVARTLFNVDVSKDATRIKEAMDTLQEVAGGSTFLRLPTWVPTPLELRARKGLRDLDEIVYGIIRERRASGEDKGDLLSMLLLAKDDDGNGMTDKQARDEAVTMFLAGHETTANALNWTFYALAQHPDILAKLHAEVDTVLAGRMPTLPDLEQLKYTEMVVKESMRLYPPVWGFGRQAMEDVRIGEYEVPQGSSLVVSTYWTHRDPRWFPYPARFDPERFNAENEPKIRKYAYVPFGGGPRICIGNSFAMMEARLLLATIVSRFTLSLAPGQRVEMLPLITLNPKGGLPMTVRRRQPAQV